MAVVVEPTASVDDRVRALLARWRSETAHVSSSPKMLAHLAYQELIALGAAALPALFRDLEITKDGHLSKALSAITGASPIPSEHRGRIQEIAVDWLQWAREHGYRW